jgi:hypothetical protein
MADQVNPNTFTLPEPNVYLDREDVGILVALLKRRERVLYQKVHDTGSWAAINALVELEKPIPELDNLNVVASLIERLGAVDRVIENSYGDTPYGERLKDDTRIKRLDIYTVEYGGLRQNYTHQPYYDPSNIVPMPQPVDVAETPTPEPQPAQIQIAYEGPPLGEVLEALGSSDYPLTERLRRAEAQAVTSDDTDEPTWQTWVMGQNLPDTHEDYDNVFRAPRRRPRTQRQAAPTPRLDMDTDQERIFGFPRATAQQAEATELEAQRRRLEEDDVPW